MAKYSKQVKALLVSYWLAIFVMTHLPGPVLPDGPVGADKLVHAGAYWLLAVLMAARRWVAGSYRGRDWITLMAVIVVYAAFDELTQMIPVIHRHADWWDGVADVAGAMTGLAMFYGLSRHCRRDNSGFGDIYESDHSSA